MKPSSNRAARAAVSLIRANRNSSNAVAGYCLAAKRSAALNSGATSGSVLDTFVAPLALSQPARTLSTTHHVQKSAMGGIFGRVEEKDDREAQDVAAEPDLSDIPPPPLEFDMIVPSDRVLKGFFDQKHVSIEPDVQKQVIRLAVDAVNDVNAANGKEVSMQENDERLFDLAGKDAANLRSLARLLSRGPGLPVAMRLYDVAVSHGDMDSEYDVARMLATGVLDIPDGQKIALQRLEDLVQRGHLPSKYTYASHLANSGQAEEGWAMMREIAEAGFADAQAQLGHALREGFEGVEKDPEEAVEWLEKAVAQGHAPASFLLSTILLTGLDSVPKDLSRAIPLLTTAAQAGLAVAQHNLAAVLMAGQDVDKDEKKAAEYWRMAAAQRFPPAMLNVAKLYVEGTVLPKDLKKARELLKATETLGGSWADEAKAGLAALDELETGGKGEKGGCSVM